MITPRGPRLIQSGMQSHDGNPSVTSALEVRAKGLLNDRMVVVVWNPARRNSPHHFNEECNDPMTAKEIDRL
jgi:hypothetical protein